jgi:hypothetical protein
MGVASRGILALAFESRGLTGQVSDQAGARFLCRIPELTALLASEWEYVVHGQELPYGICVLPVGTRSRQVVDRVDIHFGLLWASSNRPTIEGLP